MDIRGENYYNLTTRILFNFLQLLQKITSDDENVAVKSYEIASTDKNVYRSTLEFKKITTFYVAKYYCIESEFGDIKKPTYDYSDEVNSLKASSIYIYVDGTLIELNELN